MFYIFYTILFSTLLFSNSIYIKGYLGVKKSEVKDALGVKETPFWKFYKEKNSTIDNRLLPTLEDTLKSFYNSKGYYDANYTILTEDNNTIVTIDAKKPVVVNEINISSDFPIKKLIVLKKGDIFEAKKFIEIKSSIIEALLNASYCSYHLDSKAFVNLSKRVANLRFIVKKNDKCKFGDISLKGLETIDENVVLSKIMLKSGDKFNKELIQESSNNLYKLGAFDSVRIDINRKLYNIIPVDILFQEKKKPYRLEVGLGYDTFLQEHIKAKLTKNNFLGNAQRLTLKASWSRREDLFELNFLKPSSFKLLNYWLDFGLDFGLYNLEFRGFKEQNRFIRLFFFYENSKISLKVGGASEKININAIDNLDGANLSQAVSEGKFVLLYPFIEFIYDRRDSKLNPKEGYYFKAYSEMGLTQEEDATSYLKTLFEARGIGTKKSLTYSTVFKLGWIEKDSILGLPESKYFFGGGSYSNRAYGFNDIGVISSPSSDTIYGASTMLNLSFELNYPIYGKNIYGAIFNDNTMLNEEARDFSGEIISSLGVGVRYITPIGPFKLDVGFNTNDPSIYGIQFQIGQSFWKKFIYFLEHFLF